MSLEIAQRWLEKIPRIERDQPLLAIDTSAYTPNQVLDEVRRGTALGKALQAKIEKRTFSDVQDKYSLAILRLKERLGRMPPDTRLVYGVRTLTPQQVINEIQQGTKLGRQLIESEITRVAEVLGR